MSQKKQSLEVAKSEQSDLSIKAVRVYQPVQFEGTLRSYFIKAPQNNLPMHDLEMGIVYGNLVRIKTSKDDVLVPFTNVAFIALNGSQQDHNIPIRLDNE